MSLPPRPNACLPGAPISPFELALASYLYEAMTGYGASLNRLRLRVGYANDLDLGLAEHRSALLKFLNAWGCRNLAREWHSLALAEIERWYCDARERLDFFRAARLIRDVAGRRDLVEVFDNLSKRIIAHKDSKGRRVDVSFGPTATSKTLFVLRRPLSSLGWANTGDARVSR